MWQVGKYVLKGSQDLFEGQQADAVYQAMLDAAPEPPESVLADARRAALQDALRACIRVNRGSAYECANEIRALIAETQLATTPPTKAMK